MILLVLQTPHAHDQSDKKIRTALRKKSKYCSSSPSKYRLACTKWEPIGARTVTMWLSFASERNPPWAT